MNAVTAFTNRIKSLREAAGLSQNQLAAALGVSRGRISYYENGERVPDIEFLALIRNYFQVDYAYLLGESEFKNAQEIAGVSREADTLERRLDNEYPETKLRLIEIFILIINMHDSLCDAEMKVVDTFLQTILEVLSCVNLCCADAWTISEGILHAVYDGVTSGEFTVCSSELLDLSVRMQKKTDALISKLLDDIRYEATEKLADYYDMELPEHSIQMRKLREISDRLKELKAQEG